MRTREAKAPITTIEPFGAFVVLSGIQLRLTTEANPVRMGQPVILTATVSAANGRAVTAGFVSFMDGKMDREDDTLDNTGTATCEAFDLAPGPHDLTVVYRGPKRFRETTSILKLDVQVPTYLTVTGSPNPATTSDTITITVKVGVAKHMQAVRGQQIEGTVAFSEGSPTTRTVTLRKGQAKLTVGPLVALGDRVGQRIVVRYSGNPYYAASKATLIQYVQS
jgi:hypothetical protein